MEMTKEFNKMMIEMLKLVEDSNPLFKYLDSDIIRGFIEAGFIVKTNDTSMDGTFLTEKGKITLDKSREEERGRIESLEIEDVVVGKIYDLIVKGYYNSNSRTNRGKDLQILIPNYFLQILHRYTHNRLGLYTGPFIVKDMSYKNVEFFNIEVKDSPDNCIYIFHKDDVLYGFTPFKLDLEGYIKRVEIK